MKGKEGFQKGEVNNPHGRPRKPEAEILRNALYKAKLENGGTDLIEHAVNLAYKDSQVLIAIMKKILPDKLETELNDKKTLEELAKLKEETKEFLLQESELRFKVI